MTVKYIYIIVLSILIISCGFYCNNKTADTNIPQGKMVNGYVPDELTAKRIAETIWLPIYGSSVLNEKPYRAKIIGDSIWIVEGSLPFNKVGGTAYIEIRAADCKILSVSHGK